MRDTCLDVSLSFCAESAWQIWICRICQCQLCRRQADDGAVAANHKEDSVSNKSHSAHNWHLRGALMQAINVSWYQAVCRETLLVTDCCSPKLRRLQKPPDFRPRIPNVTLDYHVIAIQCSAIIFFLSLLISPQKNHYRWNFEISGTCWCATTPRSLKEKSGTVKLEDFVCQIEVGKTKIVKDK